LIPEVEAHLNTVVFLELFPETQEVKVIAEFFSQLQNLLFEFWNHLPVGGVREIF